jgi:hypothetical protein
VFEKSIKEVDDAIPKTDAMLIIGEIDFYLI